MPVRSEAETGQRAYPGADGLGCGASVLRVVVAELKTVTAAAIVYIAHEPVLEAERLSSPGLVARSRVEIIGRELVLLTGSIFAFRRLRYSS